MIYKPSKDSEQSKWEFQSKLDKVYNDSTIQNITKEIKTYYPKKYDVQVVKNNQDCFIDEGRIYLNGLTVKWICPECNKEHSMVLERDTYMYEAVTFDREEEFYLTCNNCNKEYIFEAEFNIFLNIKGRLMRSEQTTI